MATKTPLTLQKVLYLRKKKDAEVVVSKFINERSEGSLKKSNFRNMLSQKDKNLMNRCCLHIKEYVNSWQEETL